MRYYTPIIFSFLSPLILFFHLFNWVYMNDAAEAITAILPVWLADAFGGKGEVLSLLRMICKYYFYFQFYTVAAVVVSMPVVNIVFAAKGKLRPRLLSILNLLMKLLTIPMYILIVFAPVIAVIGSVWGLGIVLMVVIFTSIAVVVTALFSIPVAISGVRYGKIGKVGAFFMAFLSFIPLVDIAMAIVLTVLASKKAVTAQPPVVRV